MDGKTVVTGGLALVVGLLVGVAVAPKGGDVDRLGSALESRMDDASGRMGEAMSGLTDTLGALDAKLADLSDRVAGLEASVGDAASAGAEATAERLERLEARIDETAQAMQSAISDTADNQIAALSAALADLGAPTGSAPEAAAPEAETAAAPAAEEAPAAETAAADATPPEGLTPGETALLADGAIRVFVSRVETDAARLAINGSMALLGAGNSLAVRDADSYCRVTLDGVDRGHASVSAACGDDLPAPEGVTAGSVAMLGDGAARVFVSRVAEDDSTARIAVNGLDMQTVSAGGTVSAGDCAVRVDQIDRGHVRFGYDC